MGGGRGVEREGRPTLPFWKLSLGQSPHCHTLLASPGPSSSYARGHTGKAATLKVSSFMIRQAPSTQPLTPPGEFPPRSGTPSLPPETG